MHPTLIEAMAQLNADHSWRKYQVDYPEDTAGRFSIVHFDIAKASPERIDQVRQEGMARDTGYGTFRKLIEMRDGKGWFWMADTASEIKEQYQFFAKVEECQPKRILLTGLGLGIAVHGALMCPSVEHIDVVEINPDVVELVGKYLPDKVTVHLADAYTWSEDATWDLAWHDIWPSILESNIPEMDRLMRHYQDKVTWQDCWQRDGCIRMLAVTTALAAMTGVASNVSAGDAFPVPATPDMHDTPS